MKSGHKHPLEIEGFGSLDELAEEVGNLRYDKTRDFLSSLADDIKRQADADKGRGRLQLAEKLYQTAERLYSARDEMERAWKICEPYMKEE